MEELNAVQNEKLMDETIKHELERIKDLEPGSNEYKAAYECAAKFYEIRVKEKTNLADKNAREDELQMKNNELKIEANKAEKAWKTEVAKVVAGIASTALARRQYSCWLVPQLTRALSCSASTYSFHCATRQRTGLTARRRRTSPSKQK